MKTRAALIAVLVLVLAVPGWSLGPFFFCGPWQEMWRGRECVVWFPVGPGVEAVTATWIGPGLVRSGDRVLRVGANGRVEAIVSSVVLTLSNWRDGEGAVTWSNPSYAGAGDSNDATAELLGWAEACLIADVGAVELPAGATITRVEFAVTGHSSEPDGNKIHVVYGDSVGRVMSSWADPQWQELGAVEETITADGTEPEGGIPLTLENIALTDNTVTLLARVTDEETPATAYIDHIEVTIYYEEATAMSQSLVSSIVSRIRGTYVNTLDLTSITDALDKSYTLSFTDGTGSGKAQHQWHDQRTLTSGADETLDLTALPDGAFGDIAISEVKMLIIKLQTNTTGYKLRVGGAASNAWESFVVAAGDIVEVGAYGLFVWAAPIDGGAVDGTHKNLKLVNVAAGSLTYDIFIIGEGALA